MFKYRKIWPPFPLGLREDNTSLKPGTNMEERPDTDGGRQLVDRQQVQELHSLLLSNLFYL